MSSRPAPLGSITTATANSILSSRTMCSGREQGDLYCTLDGAHKSYCTPESYKGTSLRALAQPGRRQIRRRNAESRIGRSHVEEPGHRSSRLQRRWLARPPDRERHAAQQALSQQEGWNVRRDAALPPALAFSEDGIARAGMGADAADYDRSGPRQPDHQQLREPDGFALPQRRQRTLCRRSSATPKSAGPPWLRWASAVSFSTTIMTAGPTFLSPTATSKIEIERVQKRVSYAEPPHLFRNLGGGKFTEVTAQMGSVFAAPKVARAAAYADIDNDGSLDVLLTTNGRARLSVSQRGRNQSQPAVQTRGHEIESRWDRRGCPRDLRKRQAVEDAAVRIQLSVAERIGADLRSGRKAKADSYRNSVAQRPGGQAFEYRCRSDRHGAGREGRHFAKSRIRLENNSRNAQA